MTGHRHQWLRTGIYTIVLAGLVSAALYAQAVIVSNLVSVNVTQWGTTNVTAGPGAVTTGSPRFTLGSDDPAVAALNILKDAVGSNLFNVNLASAGGVAVNTDCTPDSAISTAAVLEKEIKATPGKLYQLVITNIDATPVYARLYNLTAANADENDTPLQRFAVSTGTSGNSGGFALPIDVGQNYTTAITLRVTTGAEDTNTGALSANEVFVSYCYK